MRRFNRNKHARRGVRASDTYRQIYQLQDRLVGDLELQLDAFHDAFAEAVIAGRKRLLDDAAKLLDTYFRALPDGFEGVVTGVQFHRDHPSFVEFEIVIPYEMDGRDELYTFLGDEGIAVATLQKVGPRFWEGTVDAAPDTIPETLLGFMKFTGNYF